MPDQLLAAIMGNQKAKPKKKKGEEEEQDLLESLMPEEAEEEEPAGEEPEPEEPAAMPAELDLEAPAELPGQEAQATQPSQPKGDGLGDRESPGVSFDYTDPTIDDESDWMKKGTKKKAAPK